MINRNYLKPDSRITVLPFQAVKEKDKQYLIQNQQGRVFKFNLSQYFFLLSLQTAESFQEAKKVFRKKLNKQSSDFKLKLLIGEFIKCNLIKSIDRIEISSNKSIDFSKYDTYKIFSSLFFGVSVFLTIILFFSFIFYFRLIKPDKSDFFYSRWNSVNLLSALFFGVLLSFFHELSHALVATSMGVKKISFRFSCRFYYLVLETCLKDIYMIKEKKRYFVYWAGIFFDFGTMGIIAFLQVLNKERLINLSFIHLRWLKQIFLIQALSILWELMIFMKTDLYYFLIDILDIEDFKFDLKKRWKTIKDNKVKVLKLTFLIGRIILLLQFVLIIFPVKVSILTKGFSSLFSKVLLEKIDGFFVLITELFYDILSITMMIKKSKNFFKGEND